MFSSKNRLNFKKFPKNHLVIKHIYNARHKNVSFLFHSHFSRLFHAYYILKYRDFIFRLIMILFPVIEGQYWFTFHILGSWTIARPYRDGFCERNVRPSDHCNHTSLIAPVRACARVTGRRWWFRFHETTEIYRDYETLSNTTGFSLHVCSVSPNT